MAERLRLLSFIDGEEGYCALLAEQGATSALRANGSQAWEARSEATIEEGRATVSTRDGELELAWSPAGALLEFGVGEAVIGAQAIAASGREPGGKLTGPGIAWDLPGERFAALRTLWTTNATGTLTLLVALRPPEAGDHGEEMVGAARLIPGAEPFAYLEPLLSTEYDGAGAHVRATLELWAGEDERAPQRGGGLRAAGGALSAGPGRLEAARFSWSLDGSPAAGGYEILTP